MFIKIKKIDSAVCRAKLKHNALHNALHNAIHKTIHNTIHNAIHNLITQPMSRPLYMLWANGLHADIFCEPLTH